VQSAAGQWFINFHVGLYQLMAEQFIVEKFNCKYLICSLRQMRYMTRLIASVDYLKISPGLIRVHGLSCSVVCMIVS